MASDQKKKKYHGQSSGQEVTDTPTYRGVGGSGTSETVWLMAVSVCGYPFFFLFFFFEERLPLILMAIIRTNIEPCNPFNGHNVWFPCLFRVWPSLSCTLFKEWS